MFQGIDKEILIYYLAGTLFIFLLVASIIIYIFLHEKKVSLYRYRLKEEDIKKKQSILLALNEGEEKERSRIAEELHDGIGAKLAGLKMKLDYLKSSTTGIRNKELIEATYKGIDESINELREISHNLQPALFAEKNLQQSIVDYIEPLNASNKCHFDLYFELNDPIGIDLKLKLHCYRIITELLHNIYKHSNATIAFVQITSEENKLQLLIEDNGKGYDFQNNFSDGIGLMNIRNRVSICNGMINIDSSKTGTTVIIELPFYFS
jgi:two-component system NarL family sensor kinase